MVCGLHFCRAGPAIAVWEQAIFVWLSWTLVPSARSRQPWAWMPPGCSGRPIIGADCKMARSGNGLGVDRFASRCRRDRFRALRESQPGELSVAPPGRAASRCSRIDGAVDAQFATRALDRIGDGRGSRLEHLEHGNRTPTRIHSPGRSLE
jgi:hypothetical protein